MWGSPLPGGSAGRKGDGRASPPVLQPCPPIAIQRLKQSGGCSLRRENRGSMVGTQCESKSCPWPKTPLRAPVFVCDRTQNRPSSNVQNGATRYDLGPLERNPPGDTVSRGSKSAAPWSRSTSSSLPHEGRVPEPQEERATLRLRLLSIASGTRYNRAAGEAPSSEPSGVLGEGSLRSLGSGRRVRARPTQDGRLPPRRRGRAIRHASPARLNVRVWRLDA
jgi:hypothetical protein